MNNLDINLFCEIKYSCSLSEWQHHFDCCLSMNQTNISNENVVKNAHTHIQVNSDVTHNKELTFILVI